MRINFALFTLAAAGLVAPAVAAANTMPSTTELIASGAHFAIVAPDGRVVADLVPVDGNELHLRIVGRTTVTVPKGDPRAFHPDLSGALGPDQMNAVWQAETERFFHVDHS